MTVVDEMAEFVAHASMENVSLTGRIQLKIGILDALGCAIGATDGGPVRRVRRFVTDFPLAGPCTLIGAVEVPPIARRYSTVRSCGTWISTTAPRLADRGARTTH
jgi:2-methylcitrate dehydratase